MARSPSTVERGQRTRRAILEYVMAFHDENGYSPSMREIAVGVGLSDRSTYSVRWQLDQLESEGVITRAPGVSRSLVVKTDAARKYLSASE